MEEIVRSTATTRPVVRVLMGSKGPSVKKVCHHRSCVLEFCVLLFEITSDFFKSNIGIVVSKVIYFAINIQDSLPC